LRWTEISLFEESSSLFIFRKIKSSVLVQLTVPLIPRPICSALAERSPQAPMGSPHRPLFLYLLKSLPHRLPIPSLLPPPPPDLTAWGTSRTTRQSVPVRQLAAADAQPPQEDASVPRRRRRKPPDKTAAACRPLQTGVEESRLGDPAKCDLVNMLISVFLPRTRLLNVNPLMKNIHWWIYWIHLMNIHWSID
jgi:hypothetical protein